MHSHAVRVAVFVDFFAPVCYYFRMEEIIKQNFSRNLSALRKSKNLTQDQLAKQFNYSDKSISKWERGDVLPDVVTLCKIAEFFGITIDQLIGDCQPKKVIKGVRRGLVFAMACCLVPFITCFIFMVCLALDVANCWLAFIYALPVACIVATVFSCVWYTNGARAICVSLLVWTVGLVVYLSVLVFALKNLWLIFTICALFQVLVVLWFVYRAKKSKSADK